MKTDALEYSLPQELIAQEPLAKRDAARLLVLDRRRRCFEARSFRELPEFLGLGDCLVFNNTRVIRARLLGHKPTGGQVEVFLLREDAPGEWEALVRPSAKVKPGTCVIITKNVIAHVGEILPEGRRRVRFDTPNVVEILEREGHLPLPPYIRRKEATQRDLERYQTVYAARPGAVAAPTAGLHYTPEVLRELERRGVRRAELTLHVGYGTFRPIRTETVEEHRLEAEDFEFPEAAARVLNETRAAGKRVVAVGTTCVRTLETQYWDGVFHAGSGQTCKAIYPPYTFQAVDALQTNFHLPRSSLLALVCAFAGTEFTLEAYRYAVHERFRFYSYGDTMLIL